MDVRHPPAVSTNWGLVSVQFISSTEGWAVGQDSTNKKGVLLRYSAGTWTSVQPPEVSTDWGLVGVQLLSSDECWAVGQDSTDKKGVLLHYLNDGWETTTPPDITSDWSLEGVDFLSSSKGWAVGQRAEGSDVRGLLLKYTSPDITVSPVDIAFQPDVTVGALLERTVRVINNGSANLVIGAITSPHFRLQQEWTNAQGRPLGASKAAK
jgi:hypothetical protein